MSDPAVLQMDYDVVHDMIVKLHALADTLDELTETGVQQYEDMRDQLKGDRGNIPPIYTDIGDALHRTARKFHRVNSEVTTRLRRDARILEDQLNAIKGGQEQGAETLKDIDVPVGKWT
ncbi:MAG: hypothetical protein E6R04_10985 [Spirochaetes bacterium]|nr:MAG: hypothetical protein E6R04_10985 [Spirochaetota bacterium]